MGSNKVAVFDTTLRDGEQAAGTRLGAREKVTLARQLARLNVDIIEAGYPNSSPEDFEAVSQIALEIDGPVICALSRVVPEDIHACGKALAKARRPRIHTGIGASDIHVMGKFRDERYGVTLEEKRVTILRLAVEAVQLARTYVDDVEFYTEDAGRSDLDYLCQMIEAVIEAGATVVNIPDSACEWREKPIRVKPLPLETVRWMRCIRPSARPPIIRRSWSATTYGPSPAALKRWARPRCNSSRAT